MPTYSINIAMPQGLLFSGEVTSCTATGLNGKFQVLHNHAPMLSIIDVGELKLEHPDGKREYIATSNGFLEINKNQLSIIVESAEWAGEIDLDRANAAKDRAEKRLIEKESIDLARAKASLMRAMNRIKIATRS